MNARAAVLLAALAVSACAGRAPKTVSMRMIGGPPNASVTIDDQFVGTLDVVARRGVALPPGSHRITVEAAGYLPWDRIVEAVEGQALVKLDVQLVRVPD